MMQILKICATVEGININEESFLALGEIGVKTTLRYAVPLLRPRSLLAKVSGRTSIIKQDIEEICGLYREAKFSAKLLLEQSDKYFK
ncbi:RuvB-like 1 [Araneus ventricosus]|uniref:RuvB-like helicase n=1 Tax=Araneus ventricosus TaxID=182803 RepID=A0A4Y2EPR7_ARAVE|nr:RuvB-like 1 [Araneus ventricosus]